MKDTEVIFHTNGRGLWSDHAGPVRIVNIDLDQGLEWPDTGHIFGELRVYFDTQTWEVRQQGLIYTDPRFIIDLRNFLATHGLAAHDVDYSEQGMQGRDYVSLDAGTEFYLSWMKKFNIPKSSMVDAVPVG